MQRRICPVCDTKLGAGSFCPVCKRWVRNLVYMAGWIFAEADNCGFCGVADIYGTEDEKEILWYGVMEEQRNHEKQWLIT